MHTDIINLLREMNAKERYWLLWNALDGDEPQQTTLSPARYFIPSDKFLLSDKFRKKISDALEPKLEIPKDSFWAMDYHLDWLLAAKQITNGKTEWSKPSNQAAPSKQTVQDVDLLIAFNDDSRTHLILVEAKCATSWKPKQVEEKIDRFKGIFGDNNQGWQGVHPHFVFLSPRESKYLNDNAHPWATLEIPPGLKGVARFDNLKGERSRDGADFIIYERWKSKN